MPKITVAKFGHSFLLVHAHIHHVVIIAMSTLCYSIMSYGTLVHYNHTCMLTLQTSLVLCALWLAHA
jgi:hypothetical protein